MPQTRCIGTVHKDDYRLFVSYGRKSVYLRFKTKKDLFGFMKNFRRIK